MSHRKSSLEYCLKKAHPFPRHTVLPAALLLGEEAPRKVPVLPLGLQAVAKGKKL